MRAIAGAVAVSFLAVAQHDPNRSFLEPPSVAISADGRFVAFTSLAQLAPADTDDARDVYVLDRADGRVSLESVAADGACFHAESAHVGISGDGRLVVFETRGAVALRDRVDGVLKILGDGRDPSISSDGSTVAFTSTATTLVAGTDANGTGDDVYVAEVKTGAVRRVSVTTSGVQPAAGSSVTPSLSADGRYIAFASTAPLDSPSIGRKVSQVYVRDTATNVTRQLSVDVRGRSPDQPSWRPAISADGSSVAFISAASSLAASDHNHSPDVLLANLQTGVIELISRSAKGGAANGASGNPAVSSDGRFVAFQSEASDLVCSGRCSPAVEDINLLPDIFLLDRQTGVMRRISQDDSRGWMEASVGPALDASGSVIAFSSRHPVNAQDLRNDFDLFVARLK